MNTSEVLRYNRQGGGFTSLKLIMFEKILVLKMHYQTIESNLLLLRAQSIYPISIPT